ncbi:uracil-DNA glycosylase [Maricaulis sp.]|jgi:uracil-DNA glycosylase|uniref:uracil-DNA glycosylase n=1 Tax=Maricaulis sp. TaxID=1486257 RepID=UPI0025F4930D|nr:uracil-DNA glycosylase [Maricaulis sp.]MDF1768498.1 uracil-DNA glycosylase [Maricaulis sp.]
MTDSGPALTPQDEKALQALIAWWADAGIEMDAPIMAPRPVAPTAPAPRSEPVPDRRRTAPAEPVRAATPQAARAAGFGDAGSGGPSARTLAAGADSLDALHEAISQFDGCALKRTARNTLFARGDRAARVMVIGDAPGRDEDERGEPFAGQTGQLMDRMLAAIGIERDAAYLTYVLNWRPPGNRAPTQDEIALCLPFAERHIALKKPDVLVLAGGLSAQALLRSEAPITRLRGRWTDYAVRDSSGEPTEATIPTLPIFHPGYLLRRPTEKRLAWQDLLALASKLNH